MGPTANVQLTYGLRGEADHAEDEIADASQHEKPLELLHLKVRVVENQIEQRRIAHDCGGVDRGA